MPMLDERASESSAQPVHRFAFDQQIGSFAPCVPYGGSGTESGAIALGDRARGGLSPKTLRRIREYIDDHIAQRIRVELLAKLANLSVCYFVRAFKRSMSVTPHEYLIRRRVELTMRLLSKTDMPLSEIALAAGFVDQSHCARRFRQHVGMSPRDYRWLTS
ncbi:helix-turn-helix domain-containing protein [Bradyrhizobium sp. AUGA SZCCT0182]|uniref:helix-turn-helix domain-containing protein n=1 Tax=Bradyrhizobium sp. AUGA SZCCT0182 TaxID=2807667 RepID=UPI001BADA28C|nr:AraC family transcriptional regulator [Bradyrhizobium sp. AUGA SZCCT0182]MBR1236993.1 helix-turn-helix transcriptional regulator [Bradyrhizobium sp. AUGA SZCCT0182]